MLTYDALYLSLYIQIINDFNIFTNVKINKKLNLHYILLFIFSLLNPTYISFSQTTFGIKFNKLLLLILLINSDTLILQFKN